MDLVVSFEEIDIDDVQENYTKEFDDQHHSIDEQIRVLHIDTVDHYSNDRNPTMVLIERHHLNSRKVCFDGIRKDPTSGIEMQTSVWFETG